ncbi:MAG: NAD-dependent epimerase/dehydratase family protein [Acidimicrobiales bacterium]
MRVLVTGGAGFIGSHVVDALVADGADVVAVDDLSSGRAENVAPQADLIEADVADAGAMERIARGCELVFHQAAHRSVPRSVDRPLETDRVNVAGTLSVLNAARSAGARRVVLASSSSVYGGADQRPTPEGAPLAPRSPYAVTKLAGEHYARVFWELYGLETVSLRYFNVYGPRQDPSSRYAAVIPLFIDAILRGDGPEVHGDGRQSRDFTFVSDAVQANVKAAWAPAEACAGRAYNIARGHPATLLELIGIVEELVATRVEPRHVPSRAGDVRHSHADIEAARADLAFDPVVSFRDGLARTVAWYRSDDAVLAAEPAGGAGEGRAR